LKPTPTKPAALAFDASFVTNIASLSPHGVRAGSTGGTIGIHEVQIFPFRIRVCFAGGELGSGLQ
jgi:hypothetical protein